MSTKIRLGATVMDRITGFEGVVTARMETLGGRIEYVMEAGSRDDDGKMIAQRWSVEECRLIEVKPPPVLDKGDIPY